MRTCFSLLTRYAGLLAPRAGLFAILSFAGTLVQADLTGEYAMAEQQRLVLNYRDDNHIRVQFGSSDLLLVIGDKTWLVTDRGGSRMAMDLDQMGALLGMAGRAGGINLPPPGSVQMQPTGKTETVAGYEGEWYIIDDGENQYRAVLTDAADVVTLTRAFGQVAGRLGRLLGPEMAGNMQQLMDEALEHGPGGVLRQADQLQLVSIERTDLPDSNYQLPAGTPTLGLPGL